MLRPGQVDACACVPASLFKHAPSLDAMARSPPPPLLVPFLTLAVTVRRVAMSTTRHLSLCPAAAANTACACLRQIPALHCMAAQHYGAPAMAGACVCGWLCAQCWVCRQCRHAHCTLSKLHACACSLYDGIHPWNHDSGGACLCLCSPPSLGINECCSFMP